MTTAVIGPYQAMLAPPGSLDAVQARAREIYASGWRPPTPPGPSRQELAALVTAAATPPQPPNGYRASLAHARAKHRNGAVTTHGIAPPRASGSAV